MRFESIASGSSGNCIYVGSDTTHLLMDVGISRKRTVDALKDLDLEQSDPLDDILDAAVINPELEHVPYPVTKKMLREAIDELEDYK